MLLVPLPWLWQTQFGVLLANTTDLALRQPNWRQFVVKDFSGSVAQTQMEVGVLRDMVAMFTEERVARSLQVTTQALALTTAFSTTSVSGVVSATALSDLIDSANALLASCPAAMTAQGTGTNHTRTVQMIMWMLRHLCACVKSACIPRRTYQCWHNAAVMSPLCTPPPL